MAARKRTAAAAASKKTGKQINNKSRSSSGNSGSVSSKDGKQKRRGPAPSLAVQSVSITSILPIPSAPAIICILASIVLYVSTIFDGTFPFDDVHAVVNNPDVLDAQNKTPIPSNISRFWNTAYWSNDFWGTPVTSPYSHKSYRPLVILSYKLDALVSREAWIFHLSNVVCYGLVVWAVVDVMLQNAISSGGSAASESGQQVQLRQRERNQIVTIAGLWFACHPVHVEVVAGLVGRAEMMAAFLCILATRVNRRRCNMNLDMCLMPPLIFVLLAGACLCKETAVVMPLVLLGGDLLPMLLTGLGRTRVKRGGGVGVARIIRWLTLIGVVLWYLTFRYRLFGGNGTSIETRPEDNFIPFLTPWSRLLTALYIMARYVQLLLFPVKLSCDYSLGVIDPVSDLLSTEMMFTVIIFGFVARLAWVAIINVRRNGNVTLLIALGWIFAPLIPASHVLNIGTVLAERLLFMPSVGIATVICHQLACYPKSRSQRQKCMGGVMIVVLYFACKTLLRVQDWNDMNSLIASDVETYPDGIKLNEMIAGINLKNASTALPHIDQAIATAQQCEGNKAFKNGKWMSYTLLAVLHGTKGSTYLQAAKGGEKVDPAIMLQKADTSFAEMVKYDQWNNAPHSHYCAYGLTCILNGKKEAGLIYYGYCFDRTKITGSEVEFDHIQNYATLLRELSGVATSDPKLSREKVWDAHKNANSSVTRGAKAMEVFDKLLAHPELAPQDRSKWEKQKQKLKVLLTQI